MLAHEVIIAGVILVALTLYILMGGADYGGGVWDLLAVGKRAKAQRDVIAEAIGPIWEANHVWLILVIVLLFTAFPLAFSTISTYLHIPLSLMLVGIIMRGSAFTFRTYDSKEDRIQGRWGRIFAIASITTPVLLGIIVGAISSDTVRLHDSSFLGAYVYSWWSPFSLSVGLFALVLFSFLAATYLTTETDDKELQDDFRLRALVSSLAVGVMALVVFLLADKGAPEIRDALIYSSWTVPLHLATSASAICAMIALWLRKYPLAVIFAGAQATFILWGWGLSQFPFLVRPDLTIFNTAAPVVTLRLLVIALAIGACVLFPSFFYLFKVFKGQRAFTALDNEDKH